jgi:hypothetical protein
MFDIRNSTQPLQWSEYKTAGIAVLLHRFEQCPELFHTMSEWLLLLHKNCCSLKAMNDGGMITTAETIANLDKLEAEYLTT